MPKFQQFEPNVSFRYELSMSPFNSIRYLCKAINLPSIDQGEIVIDYINTDFKVKGKSRWQDVTLQIYDAVGSGPSGTNVAAGPKEIHDWLLKHHDSLQGKDDWAFPSGGGYKRSATIKVLEPDGVTNAYHWDLTGVFISAINFGSMDWATEDAVIAEITLKYDYAEFFLS